MPLPNVGLAAVDDPNCHSTLRPVVLLHGTFGSTALSFATLIPTLVASGRCVYAVDFPEGGIKYVQDSANRAAELVRAVLAHTGATQVDLVGFSLGGLVARTALRGNDIAGQVHTLVMIAPSFHGTTASIDQDVPVWVCPACADQRAGSSLLRRLDQGGDLDAAVQYAVVATRRDAVVTPPASQVPTGPDDRVVSIFVEDRCPGAHADHQHLPSLPGVKNWVIAALATDGHPDPAALTC